MMYLASKHTVTVHDLFAPPEPNATVSCIFTSWHDIWQGSVAKQWKHLRCGGNPGIFICHLILPSYCWVCQWMNFHRWSMYALEAQFYRTTLTW